MAKPVTNLIPKDRPMPDKKNALAKLVDELEVLRCRLGYENAVLSMPDLIKAQRIIAELAKVQGKKATLSSKLSISPSVAHIHLLHKATSCFVRCLAIAEEGGKK